MLAQYCIKERCVCVCAACDYLYCYAGGFICSDRKTEALADLKEELEHHRATIQQLHQEKKELAEDAKLARVYRDEIETLKVQSAKVEKLEADVVKYRQKAEDAEYLRKRIAVSRSALPVLFSLSLSLSLSPSLCGYDEY